MEIANETKDDEKKTDENIANQDDPKRTEEGASGHASLLSSETAASNIHPDTRDQIIATLYGQCMGDAIGLLSEFYSKEQAVELFGKMKQLEYETKDMVNDSHRCRWETGDWTDDSDQMLLIMQSLVDNNGEVDPKDFGAKLHNWMKQGFKELGDPGGFGIGATTSRILNHPDFLADPHKAAEDVWNAYRRSLAPNGGVMRTSILGIHDWWDTDAVEKNAVAMCKVTHRDPRCLASVVAVCVAISLMLQKKHYNGKHYDITKIKAEAQRRAISYLQEDEFRKYMEERDETVPVIEDGDLSQDIRMEEWDTTELVIEDGELSQMAQISEFQKYMNVKRLRDLKLGDKNSIGYTLKCMGAGFWSLKKDNFREALQKIVREGGDADTNGAVVGALLACKLRHTDRLPESWTKFKHKEWLDGKIASYIELLDRRYAEMTTR